MSRLMLLVILLFGSLSFTDSLHAVSSKSLPPLYRKWIDEDVPYIITQDERNEFLRLTTNDQRDHFMEQFWESRNPTPHSPINTFKEEHYRRLAYVREHFGDARYNDGWRTDQGRVYITLGAPQQTAKYHEGRSTRPVEIWFYQSPSPALPPYFNLVFYKWSDADPYTLYSPRQDGPTRLVTNDLHDDKQAIRTIKDSMGSEAAHTMISLIPGEPSHLENPQYSGLSDNLLDEVRNLPEQKLERERIAHQRAANSEQVTVNILNGSNASDLQYTVLRDKTGESAVNLLLNNRQPDPSLIGMLPDDRHGYTMNLRVRVMTADGKAVYERRQELLGEVSDAGAKAGQAKLFGAEARLPLVPGHYVVETTLTNQLTHTSSRHTTPITVPETHADTLGISGLMAFRGTPVRDLGGQLPFTLGEVRFPPRGEQIVDLRTGENLPIAYQVWLPSFAKAEAGKSAPTIHAQYVLAPLSESSDASRRVQEDEDISTADADAVGNLLTGHKLLTTSLPYGTYRLMVKLTLPGKTGAAFSSMTVHIVPSSQPVDMWTAYGDERAEAAWQDSLLRGISAQVQGDKAKAATYFQTALQQNPEATEARTRLGELQRSLAQGKAAEVR